jgi:hypothetical protein
MEFQHIEWWRRGVDWKRAGGGLMVGGVLYFVEDKMMMIL